MILNLDSFSSPLHSFEASSASNIGFLESRETRDTHYVESCGTHARSELLPTQQQIQRVVKVFDASCENMGWCHSKPKHFYGPTKSKTNANSYCALVYTGPGARGFGVNLTSHFFKALQFFHFMLFAQCVQICVSTLLGKKDFCCCWENSLEAFNFSCRQIFL